MATLEITTLIGCPLACKFCPQDKLTQNYTSNESRERSLSLDKFKVYLSNLPSHVRIDFSGFSEPFSNPECMSMIKVASLTPNPIALYTTLQGVKVKDVDTLHFLIKSSRITPFVIHLPDNYGNMLGFKMTDEYLYALEILSALPEASLMTMSDKAAIHPDLLEQIKLFNNADLILGKLPRSAFVGVSRAGTLNMDKVDGQQVMQECNWKCAISCKSTPFYDHNVLLPDGRVALCCMDYGLQHIIGDISGGYYNMFENSRELAKVHAANMAYVGKSICRNCENVICHETDSNGQWKSSA